MIPAVMNAESLVFNLGLAEFEQTLKERSIASICPKTSFNAWLLNLIKFILLHEVAAPLCGNALPPDGLKPHRGIRTISIGHQCPFH